MKVSNRILTARKALAGGGAPVGMIVLALVSFVVGVTAGALWFTRKAPALVTIQSPQPSPSIGAAINGETPQTAVIVAAPPGPSAEDRAAMEAVRRAVPNLETTSLEAATAILRKAAIAEFERTARELRAKQNEFEHRSAGELGSNGHEKADPEKLQQLQLEQMTRLKEIAAHFKAQCDALQQLKDSVR